MKKLTKTELTILRDIIDTIKVTFHTPQSIRKFKIYFAKALIAARS